MRIPHFIDINCCEAYKPFNLILKEFVKDHESKTTSTSELRKSSEECVPILKQLCLQAIAKNFEKYPIIKLLPDFLKLQLVPVLSCDIDLQLAVFFIDEEYYWERRYYAHFPFKKFKVHIGWTWKCVYLEQFLSRACEQAQPEYKDEEFRAMMTLLDICSNFVRILDITQLQECKSPKTVLKRDYPSASPDTRINFEPILVKLPFLTELHICFGINDIGVNYTPHKFIVDPKDCELLGKAVGKMRHLKLLKIHNSKIGDLHMKYMVRNLIINRSLEVLELPYCQIGDMGAKCIGLLLNIHPRLKYLNLKGNHVGTEGILGLAWSIIIPEGTFLDRLDLSSNPINDLGIMNLCQGLVRRSAPKELSISNCEISDLGAIRIAKMLKVNKTIQWLDISENYFGRDAGEKILESLEYNNKLCDIIMNNTKIPNKIEQNIKRMVKQNRIRNSIVDTDINLDYLQLKHNTKFTSVPNNMEDPPIELL